MVWSPPAPGLAVCREQYKLVAGLVASLANVAIVVALKNSFNTSDANVVKNAALKVSRKRRTNSSMSV